MLNATARILSRGTWPGIHCTSGGVVLRVGLDGCEKSPHEVSKRESSSPQGVAIPNTLSSLSLKCFANCIDFNTLDK